MGFLELGIRTWNTVWYIISLGLACSLIATQDSSHARVNICLWASLWGLLFSSVYGFLAEFMTSLAWPVILLTFELLNAIFTFSAATALAVGIRTHSCSNQSYLNSNAICEGSESRCRKSQALVTFLYFCFFGSLGLLFFIARKFMSGGPFGHKYNSNNAPKVGVPTMSQV
ncbi:Fhn1p ASCRUDRAFT_82630 [Ascoidea rubescens DSM 1968]|uniref:MARVEL domain-containing protein n=1 Tax=Ascoidea rubescens DSM 1968 TaxID=1344418 RepID=A0A1D2VBA4_9ASCO|nr:hypothetical protein ASCRUDRAFT_82630 [Ascoidea rubescens DSM 1968]ODV58727.1 hypothetical protein ASCRUDRAFT_82630 [Ascoidea rubescens DSM 1968]